MDTRSDFFQILWRLAEFALYEIVISAASGALIILGYVQKRSLQATGLILLGALVYLLLMVWKSRQHFRAMGFPFRYILINIIAYIIFALIATAFCLFMGSSTFAWLFTPTRVFTCISKDINDFASLMMFHGLMVITILVAPLGISLHGYAY